MEAVKSIPTLLRIREQAALVLVYENAFHPARPDIVFGAGAVDRRVLLIAVDIQLDLPFAPPAGLIRRIYIHAGADTEETPFSGDSFQQGHILAER
jgi:hypothetical protein